jgi:hypothetical protein
MSRAVETGSLRIGKGGYPKGYFEDSELPLTSLVFLLPFMVIYEIGTRHFTTAAQSGHDQQIIAFTMMRRFFLLWGLHGQHLPAVALVTWLLCIHAIRGKPWHFHLSTLIGMFAESILLALPLIALALELSRYFPLAATPVAPQDKIIMSLGAGVYEELVFRLILFNVLAVALKDALRLNSFWVHLGVVVVSALAFSAYHYLSPLEHFQWKTCVFRTAAGAYFGIIFLLRGFGITAGCHASYDIIILFL